MFSHTSFIWETLLFNPDSCIQHAFTHNLLNTSAIPFLLPQIGLKATKQISLIDQQLMILIKLLYSSIEPDLSINHYNVNNFILTIKRCTPLCGTDSENAIKINAARNYCMIILLGQSNHSIISWFIMNSISIKIWVVSYLFIQRYIDKCRCKQV